MNAPGNTAGALLLVAMMATPSPAPVPAGAPLPEIGRVRSTALCSTLVQAITPTLAGLVKNDQVISAGHNAYRKMSADQTMGDDGSLELDRNYMSQVVRALSHNLAVVDKLLADEKRFPKYPKTDDDRAADGMKAQLQAIAKAQSNALDLINGTLETERLGQMKLRGSDDPINTATSNTPQTGGPTPPPSTSFLDAASLPAMPGEIATPGSQLVGNTQYDRIRTYLETAQVKIDRTEQPATAVIMPVVRQCAGAPAPAGATPRPAEPLPSWSPVPFPR